MLPNQRTKIMEKEDEEVEEIAGMGETKLTLYKYVQYKLNDQFVV